MALTNNANLPDDIKEDWLARLRSGEYRQGSHNLNSNGMFCCLGVLCEIAVEQGVLTREHEVGEFGETERMQYRAPDDEVATAALPDYLQQIWGMHEFGRFAKPDDIGGSGYGLLSQLNDTGTSFEQIADIIEKEF